jgi:hypothetical protein
MIDFDAPFWEPLKKGTVIVHATFEHRTDTLFADTVQWRESEDAASIDVSFDLNKSLRSRSKQSNTYIDAKHLSDGEIGELKSFQVDDEQVIKGIERKLDRIKWELTTVRLLLLLKGEHWFDVRPQLRHRSLTFTVVSKLDKPPAV